MAKSSKKTSPKKSSKSSNDEISKIAEISINVPAPPSISKPIISDVKITSDVVKEKKVTAKKVLTNKKATKPFKKNTPSNNPTTDVVVIDDVAITEITIEPIGINESNFEKIYEPEKEQESFMLPIEEVQRRITEAAKGKSKEEIIKSIPQPKVVVPSPIPPSPNTVFNQITGNAQTTATNIPSETKDNELNDLVLENDFSSSAAILDSVLEEDKHFHTIFENVKRYLDSFAFNMKKQDFEKILPTGIIVSYYKGGIVLSKGKFNCKVFCKMNFY